MPARREGDRLTKVPSKTKSKILAHRLLRDRSRSFHVNAPKTEHNAHRQWAGVCKKCGIVWWWPKQGHRYKEDLPQARCPKCRGVLGRAHGYQHKRDEVTTRQAVRLGGSSPSEEKAEKSSGQVLAAVAAVTGVSQEAIVGPSRKQGVVAARHIAAYFLRQSTPLSLPGIGTLLGGRDHSTILHAITRAGSRAETDKTFRVLMSEVNQRLTHPQP